MRSSTCSGERAAISLAVGLKAGLLLSDDSGARRAAQLLEIPVAGTIGVILAADRLNLIDARAALNRLKATNCYLSSNLIEDAYRRALGR